MRRTAAVTAVLAAAALAAVLLPTASAGASDPTLPGQEDATTATPSPSGSTTTSPAAAPEATSSGPASATPGASGTSSPPVNSAPLPVDDAAAVRWGSSVRVAVLANDEDPDGDPLTLVDVGAGQRGQAVVDGGTVVYTPDGASTGLDLVPYTVGDGRGATAVGTLAVEVGRASAVTLRLPTRPHALRTYRVTGAVTAADGAVPVVRVQRWQDGRWLLVDTPEVAGGAFTTRWTPKQTGVVRWRAVAQWPDGDSLAGAAQRTRVVARLDPVVQRVTRADLPYTWRPGCPVGPDRLRALRMTYRDYDGRLRRGVLVGASWAVADYVRIFGAALRGGFPIKKMYPVDRYKGSDVRAMGAGNTSAFNCRHVTGNPYRMSQHSWGDAIDINTFENPYATGSRIYPVKAAVPYYHRRAQNLDDPGVITTRSPIAQALFQRGWYWGARWSLRDYQHWSRNGG